MNENKLHEDLAFIDKTTKEMTLRITQETNLKGAIPLETFNQAQKAISISRAIAYDRILLSEGIQKVM